MKRYHLYMVIALAVVGCKATQTTSSSDASVKKVFVEVQKLADSQVRVYYPNYSRIDLRCGTMPSQDEADVIFCAEAAFTEALSDTFTHANIDGNHVASGVWYEGAECIETPDHVGNTGGFVWYDGQWEFLADTASAENALKHAAEAGGMGFRQEIILHQGKYVPNARTENPRFNRVEYFRVLAEWEGRLCIIENSEPMQFSQFLQRMQAMGVTEALYMDMGAGWNHSWYRLPDGIVKEIHPVAFKSRYCTNWITFYK